MTTGAMRLVEREDRIIDLWRAYMRGDITAEAGFQCLEWIEENEPKRLPPVRARAHHWRKMRYAA